MKLGRTTPSPAAAMRIETEALEALQQELGAKGYQYSRPQIEQMPWGRDLSLHDPFGNRLTFAGAAGG